MSKIYRVPVYYKVSEYIPVKANSADEAVKYVWKHQEEFSTHCGEAYYLDDSYEVESELDLVHGYDEDSGSWAKESWADKYYDGTKEKTNIQNR